MHDIDCTKLSGKDIAERVVASPDFFYCIVRSYEGQLKAYIARITNVDNEEVEDILQEAFIKVYENINSYDSDFKFSSWLYRIVRNETISHWRKNKKRLEDVQLDITEDFISNLRADTDLNTELDEKFVKEDIQKALNKLPFKYKEVLVLRYIEDRDYKDIGDIIKKPVNTVGTLISRAKKELKNILE
ncbi:MAG: RNA polymerase sigma factor [Candidatus Komeilibacteria bacterium]